MQLKGFWVAGKGNPSGSLVIQFWIQMSEIFVQGLNWAAWRIFNFKHFTIRLVVVFIELTLVVFCRQWFSEL